MKVMGEGRSEWGRKEVEQRQIYGSIKAIKINKIKKIRVKKQQKIR